uniref:Dynamin GTPase n=1 Tax=Fibrocapsa japonica TaxID=94617 RepID=A0A7S2V112_9STRA
MEQLIPVVNRLQDVFSAVGEQSIDLPQIVVIGSQSSGKSSVLENFVGRDFLPRGTGIVTRRPLILQLYNTSKGGSSSSSGSSGRTSTGGGQGGQGSSLTPSGGGHPGALNGDLPQPPPVPSTGSMEEYGVFLHKPRQKFYDFHEIREEIISETERLVGRNKGISSKSINLKIYSPNVLTLTLIDLPGITKVSVGDQPLDIEDQIRELCLQFIANPKCIVLAVTPANSDLANSDALKLAREVDPEGDRTIGVLTKLDLMDPGTDATDMLQNRVIPLRRGYVAVVNRGQRDIEGNVNVKESLVRERRFFQQHPAYKHLLHRCTTPTLAKSLNSMLMHHIRDTLPEIKQKISQMSVKVTQEMCTLGDPMDSMNGGQRGSLLLTLLSKFASNFQSAVDGKNSSSRGIEMTELHGGARISFIFHEILRKSLEQVDPFDGLTDSEIRTTIANAHGTRPSLFLPEISFDLLVKRQISRLEQPALQCADLVFDEMQRIATQCEMGDMVRFPSLRSRVAEVVGAVLRRCVKPTQAMISHLIQIELAYINTRHPDFIGLTDAVALCNQHRAEQQNQQQRGGQYGRQQSSGAGNLQRQGSHQQTHQQQQQQQPQQQHRGIIEMIFGNKDDDEKNKQRKNNGPRDEPPPVKLPQPPETMRQTAEPSETEMLEVHVIKTLVASYFTLVRKNVLDLVPKTIMHFLVNDVKDSLQNELVSHLYKEDLISELLRETDDVAAKRIRCKETHTLLNMAMEIINEVRDIDVTKMSTQTI